jgi:hypothetical protein
MILLYIKLPFEVVLYTLTCGEGGIRTLGTPVGAHTLSRRARSTAPAPLQKGAQIYTLYKRLTI